MISAVCPDRAACSGSRSGYSECEPRESRVPVAGALPEGKGVTRRAIARNLDIPWRADNSKSRQELGVTCRPLKESMEEMFQQMIEEGIFDEA